MRLGVVLALFAALGVGLVLGGLCPSTASAGPAVVGGNPTHYFITNSEGGRDLYIWAVTNGTVEKVSLHSIEAERHPSPGVTYGPPPKLHLESTFVVPKPPADK